MCRETTKSCQKISPHERPGQNADHALFLGFFLFFMCSDFSGNHRKRFENI
ncbi:hypothetical protein MTR67_047755 [Solanum verrucosum]|uniref:Uncharacterized protein n=1 Tax=Solanum verrucosum TaxID=315347 RepID=A0AAF0UX21_SOLVR|nr:hypothetical protein MTR67_047755 [Solanum verrucosum]